MAKTVARDLTVQVERDQTVQIPRWKKSTDVSPFFHIKVTKPRFRREKLTIKKI